MDPVPVRDPDRRRRARAGPDRHAALHPGADPPRGHPRWRPGCGPGWATEDALRAFADDLDDATGDLVAANLILGARRRGAGLASVLEGLAESVAADVRARREIEADRAKPRATARWVTIITIGVLAVLALTGDYVAPYGTPFGQVILVVLLSLYVATLVWMRRMAIGPSPPPVHRRRREGGGPLTPTGLQLASPPAPSSASASP